MSFPASIHVSVHPADPPQPVGTAPRRGPVIMVHGSLDRGESFRRVIRRLSDLDIVTYDRRGYQGSRSGGVTDIAGHADDLTAIVEAAGADGRSRRATAIGHSLGGDVVMAAALARPELFASIAAYEPPLPWLGFRRNANGHPNAGPATFRPWPTMAEDPGDEAEQFFRRMVGDSAWERLPRRSREGRRADGPALIADLRGIRRESLLDPTALRVPAVFARGGTASNDHHRTSVAWLANHVPGAVMFEIEGASHGAHLSHPDAFADLVRLTVERGAGGGRDAGAGPTAASQSERGVASR